MMTNAHCLLAALGVCYLTALTGAAQADSFNETYENAKVESANTAALCAALGSGTCTVGTENFDTRTTGSTFTTNYGTGGVISGTYTGVQINSADQFGGAGGTGKYPVAFTSTPYQVNLTTSLTTGINYFGYWLSALDAGNTVSFYRKGVDVYDFTPSQVIAALGACSGSNAYCANPNSAFSGQNSSEQYVFVNFFDLNGTFDSIHFNEVNYGGGYESDNHTVGYVTAETGHQVPEPSSVALLGAGLVSLAALHRLLRGRANRARPRNP